VNTLVIDASVAVKWVVEENGTPEVLALRQRARLIAPELLVAECANIFWKKVRRNELLKTKRCSPPVFSRAPRSNYCRPALCLRPQREYRSKLTTPPMTVCTLPWPWRINVSSSQPMNTFCGNFVVVVNARCHNRLISLLEAVKLSE